MESAEQNYSACERKAAAAVFGVTKSRIRLLSAELFSLLARRQVLHNSFKKENIRSRLVGWLEIISMYEFSVYYASGGCDCEADCLLRY